MVRALDWESGRPSSTPGQGVVSLGKTLFSTHASVRPAVKWVPVVKTTGSSCSVCFNLVWASKAFHISSKLPMKSRINKSFAGWRWACLFFSVCLCPKSRSYEGQGQIFLVQGEGLFKRINVCEYNKIHHGVKKLWPTLKFLHDAYVHDTMAIDSSSNFSSKNWRANKFVSINT